MKYFLSFSIIFLSLSFSGYSQLAVTVSRKQFKVEKQGFSEAWRHIKKGDSYFDEEKKSYPKALAEYLEANKYNPANPELNYKIGAAYFCSDQENEAPPFLSKAYELKNNVAKDVLLLSARSQMFNGRYNEAIDEFKNYLSLPGKKTKAIKAEVKKYIGQCEAALIVTKDTLRLEIKNIGPNINSSSDDYSEILSPQGSKMLFASRRAMTAKSKSNYADGKFDENIFSSDLVNGVWSVSMLFDKNLVTKYCETPLYLNDSENQLYIYAGYQGNGDIMVSNLKRGKWKTPVPVRFNLNTNSSETSFSMNHAGNEIAFVSDRGRIGLGGKDVYFIKKLNKRRWSKPVNAGPSINTEYDEEAVRFSSGGDTLWFSSEGHNSIGGFDIFYSTRNLVTGAWNPAVNAGFPLNSPWDDMFYYPSPGSDSTFFFASDRPGGLGGLDIWTGRILPPTPPPQPVVIPEPVPVPVTPPKRDTVVVRDTVVIIKEIQKPVQPEPPKELVLYLTGRVTDSETKEPVLARIEVFDLSTDQIVNTTASSDVDGTYRVKLPAKKSYMVNLRATGYLSDMKRVTLSDSYMEEFYTLDATLVKVKVGKKVVLNNILFELGKSVLTGGSYAELNRLVSVLEDSPQMKIEISGHTDNTGSPVINAKLSNDRAKAVVDYLVRKGIDIGRLTYKGYGSEQPIADNATAAGKAKNRRVEFKILGI
jgi:outer membrane protein OmpA-like peptidoglycan-associated protein/tetratricopeptide (TPR) repeat protein